MRIENLCRECGFRAHYRGYRQLIDCIQIALDDEERLMYVTGICYEVSLKYNVSTSGVERNIRTLIKKSWEEDEGKLLGKVLETKIDQKPTASKLIEMFVYYLKHHKEK